MLRSVAVANSDGPQSNETLHRTNIKLWSFGNRWNFRKFARRIIDQRFERSKIVFYQEFTSGPSERGGKISLREHQRSIDIVKKSPKKPLKDKRYIQIDMSSEEH